MSRKQSEFLKALGVMMEIWKAIVYAVFDKGGSDEDLRRVVTMPGLATKIAEVIMASAEPVIPPIDWPVARHTVFKVVTEYIQPTYEDVKATFRHFTSTYSPRFVPIARCKNVPREVREITLVGVRSCRLLSTDEILSEMDRLGLRPALFEELYALSRQFLDEPKQGTVLVALGSIWVDPNDPKGRRVVATIQGQGSDRALYLTRYIHEWGSDYLFLAVPK